MGFELWWPARGPWSVARGELNRKLWECEEIPEAVRCRREWCDCERPSLTLRVTISGFRARAEFFRDLARGNTP